MEKNKTANTYQRLLYFFSKESLLDGRVIIACGLVLYFLIIYSASFFGDYTKLWHVLGVPAGKTLFGDLQIVTTAIKCPAVINHPELYLNNPCTLFAYPEIWYWLAPVWVNSEQVIYFAVFIIFSFYLVVFILLKKININSGIYYLLLLLSPPMMTAVERGQPDLIIFIFFGLAILLENKSLKNETTSDYELRNTNYKPIIYKILASIMILLGGFLKFYPFAGAVAFINNAKKKSSLILISALVAIASIYVLINLKYIITLNEIIFKYYWSVSVGFIHGAKVYFTLLNTYPFFNHIFQYASYSLLAYLLVLVLTIVLFVLARKNWKKASPFDYTASSSLFSFRLGASLYIGSFVIGNNYDYKFIFFLFTIPQMIYWIRNAEEQIKKATLFSLLAIFITCWSLVLFQKFYWIIYTTIEEAMNWYIFGYFIFMFFISLPLWTKKMLGFKKLDNLELP